MKGFFEKEIPIRRVVVSTKWMMHKFSCTEDYILNNCKGRCCEGTNKILISLLPEEVKKHEKMGFVVKYGLLQPNLNTGKCPHKMYNGLCGIHGTDMKPFGCIASPFTLNSNGTLIVRNRYTKLRCHGNENEEPAYKVFRTSLNLIFGFDAAENICSQLDQNKYNITTDIPEQQYQNLIYLDALKHE